jgi:hypothetical protein
MRLGSLNSPAILLGVALLGLTACTGGPGSGGGEGIVDWEPAPSSNERANSTGNSSSSVSVNAPTPAGTGTTNSNDCSGTYTCSAGGTTSTIVLTKSGNSCVGSGAGVSLTSDGKVTANGQNVGTWSQAGSTIIFAVNGTSGTCSKASGSTTGTGTPANPTGTAAPAPSK